MNYERTTQVPNILFDEYLPALNLAELKLLLVIIRQTNGWIDKRTGKRKLRDRISHGQFIAKTTLSRRVLSSTIQSLIDKEYIVVSDVSGNVLTLPWQRKGKQYLFYQFTFRPVQNNARTYAIQEPRPVQKTTHNKTNIQKTNTTELTKNSVAIRKIINDIKSSMQF